MKGGGGDPMDPPRKRYASEQQKGNKQLQANKQTVTQRKEK